MNRSLSSRTALVSIGALVALTVTGATASAGTPTAGAPKEPALVGSAKIHYAYAPDDDIRFDFDAHGFYTLARGTFHFRHSGIGADGRPVTGEAWGKVDCLATGGDTATMTGTITRTVPPGIMAGAVGFSVAGHGRHQRLGFSWGVLESPAELPGCYAIAPFTTVTAGHFAVTDAPLPAVPVWLSTAHNAEAD
ncbi:hypothetical protein OG417_30410 [Actinoallomurus sp. NBC_01490]|uniref:hypothetical protein n=1 Tax=Actinoallomurus sp. NBC_01490 TaxID=2903557 RepID=UPI002E338FA2|nr:hypothetical protein [Actinoallomurus sp. NBC_01490]